MISVEEAKDIITNRTQQLPKKKMNVVDSVGHTVSENVVEKNDYTNSESLSIAFFILA